MHYFLVRHWWMYFRLPLWHQCQLYQHWWILHLHVQWGIQWLRNQLHRYLLYIQNTLRDAWWGEYDTCACMLMGNFSCVISVLAPRGVGNTYVDRCIISLLDIDECTSDFPCDISANCTNTDGSYICMCNEGYGGSGITCTGICYTHQILLCHLPNQGVASSL